MKFSMLIAIAAIYLKAALGLPTGLTTGLSDPPAYPQGELDLPSSLPEALSSDEGQLHAEHTVHKRSTYDRNQYGDYDRSPRFNPFGYSGLYSRFDPFGYYPRGAVYPTLKPYVYDTVNLPTVGLFTKADMLSLMPDYPVDRRENDKFLDDLKQEYIKTEQTT